MQIPDHPPDWLAPPDLKAAGTVQRLLAEKVRAEPLAGPVRTVAGVDVSQFPRDPRGLIFAAVVLLDAETMRIREVATALRRAPMPYVPGYLGFREVPALLAAFADLSTPPDRVMVDGHGVSHPRGLGIAAHLGVLLDRPCFGVAKSILVGKPAAELGEARGSTVPLRWKNRDIGTVLRTKNRVNPVFISIGQRVTEGEAVEWALRLSPRYRLPEPTRQAHEAANAFRRRWLEEGGTEPE